MGISRRRAAVGAALAVAALLVTVAVVARPDGGQSTLVAVDGAPNDVVGSYVPSPSPTPSPSATATRPVRPSPTPSASPTRSRGPRTVTTESWDRKEPGAVTFAYEPGRSSWSATSHGIRLAVSVTPAHPRVGERTVWHLTMSSADGRCCVPAIGFSAARSPTSSVDCTAAPVSSVDFAVTFNRAARQEFFVEGLLGCDGEHGIFYGTFDVAPGVRSGQGPSLPTVLFDDSSRPAGHEDDRTWVTLYGEAEDADGYVTKLVVSFGDGTTKTFANEARCERNSDGWPLASRAWLPHDPPYAHHYAKPGDYTLTLTAYSASCDGREVQSGTASFVWAAY